MSDINFDEISFEDCETVGDWWQKQADAGCPDAKSTLARTDRHRRRRRAGLLDCVVCGYYFVDCQCESGRAILPEEVEAARKEV